MHIASANVSRPTPDFVEDDREKNTAFFNARRHADDPPARRAGEGAMSMDVRRVLLVPPGARLEDPRVTCLPMEERVWESGYTLVIDEVKRGLLQDFWKHYYGSSAEMDVSGVQLMEFRKDIMAVTPECVGQPAVLRFLVELGRMCVQAYRQDASLRVVTNHAA